MVLAMHSMAGSPIHFDLRIGFNFDKHLENDISTFSVPTVHSFGH